MPELVFYGGEQVLSGKELCALQGIECHSRRCIYVAEFPGQRICQTGITVFDKRIDCKTLQQFEIVVCRVFNGRDKVVGMPLLEEQERFQADTSVG